MVMNVVAKTLVRSRIWTVLVSYHVRTCGEVAELRNRSVQKVDVLEKANCCNNRY